MTEPLFFEPELAFEKVASEVQLPEDPNQWPSEILDQAFRQVPYVADFELGVNMDRVDAERGFGFGHVEVTSRTEASCSSLRAERDAAGIRRARIPIIIRESRLQPLDVIVTEDAKMLPLTEARLRQALFRPESFDTVSDGAGDPSTLGQLYPPHRQNSGFRTGVPLDGGATGKLASALESALQSANESDLDDFKAAARDRDLKLAFVANPASFASIERIARARPVTLGKIAEALPRFIKPSVLQLAKLGDGYRLRTASALCWAPETEVIDRGEAVRRCGHKMALAADVSGSATLADGEGVSESFTPPSARLVSEPGEYVVWAMDGQPLTGTVIPNLLDIDGSKKPIALFVGESHVAVQSDVAGVPRGPAVELEGLSAADAQGKGVFIAFELGQPQATIPFEIKAVAQTSGGGRTHLAETLDGRRVELEVVEVPAITPGPRGTVLIPHQWQWLSLGDLEPIGIVSSASDVDKTASLQRRLSSVELRSDGSGCFSLSGYAVEKIAADERTFVSQDDTLFLLGGLGVGLEYAQRKMAEALVHSRPVDVRVGRAIVPFAEAVRQSKEGADQYLRRMPSFRQKLWKEAAVIPDPVAVDTVLSLAFINAENVSTFVSYLPVLEEAARRMCELLVASRLGLKHVPTPALEKAIRATEQVIEGLKEMAFQE